MWFLIAALALPLVEIALLIQIGGLIGLWPTLAWIVGSGVLGLAVIRGEGARALTDVRLAAAELRATSAVHSIVRSGWVTLPPRATARSDHDRTEVQR